MIPPCTSRTGSYPHFMLLLLLLSLLQWSMAKVLAALPPDEPVVVHRVQGREVQAVHAARVTELAGGHPGHIVKVRANLSKL